MYRLIGSASTRQMGNLPLPHCPKSFNLLQRDGLDSALPTQTASEPTTQEHYLSTASPLKHFEHATSPSDATTKMSQDYFSSKGKARDDDILDEPTAHDSTPAPSSVQSPRYMAVGNGSAPEYAAQVQALLDGNDSGYGGSSNDNNHAASLARDYATQPDIHNHSQASAIHQLWYG